MNRLAKLSLVAFLAVVASSSYADDKKQTRTTPTSRCPADNMGCTSENYEQKYKERIQQGKDEVRQSRGPVEAAKAVGRTVRDCADCGTKVITDSMSTAGENNSSK
jgi:hypothetical protein